MSENIIWRLGTPGCYSELNATTWDLLQSSKGSWYLNHMFQSSYLNAESEALLGAAHCFGEHCLRGGHNRRSWSNHRRDANLPNLRGDHHKKCSAVNLRNHKGDTCGSRLFFVWLVRPKPNRRSAHGERDIADIDLSIKANRLLEL